jgi:serine/threonine protein kinase
MTLCCECGANIAPGEIFCGHCGARQQPHDDTPVVSDSGNVAADSGSVSTEAAAVAEDQKTGVPGNSEKPAGEGTTSIEEETGPTPASGTAELVESAEFLPMTSRTDDVREKRQKPKALAGGKVLNHRYEIVRRIGGGGMGAVYLAKDRNLGEAPRAVKEMIESHLDDAQHEKAIADFKRESLLLTELEHPSIPTVYDYFYEDESERFYLVMKFIPGSDLSSRLRSSPGGRVDELSVTEWGIQVADVLEYLHTRPQPIIYRDLKPANLMIDSNNNRIMLIDFGIARWVNKKEKGVTAVGTMGYAPPELFSGQADPRVDIYSLGATMFHLLTGADPQDNPLLIFDFTKNPRPRQINPALSSEMERLLIRAVEYKPEHRFQSGAELRDALAAHLEKLRSGHVTYGAPAFELGGETMRAAIVFCGLCGGRIAADDIFCAHCGSRQPGDSSASLAQARATAKLIVNGTTELDASFLLQKDSNLVGRTDPLSNIFPEVDLSRFDPLTKVSRRHARIWREGEVFMVEDLGSVNGTVINDMIRLEPRQPRALDNGDRIRMGETTLHFLVG